MPPLSSMSRWSGMKSMTGFSVNMSNSVELTSFGPDDLAGELDDRALQPEAQPEVRHAVVAGEVGGEDLALDAAMAEAARDEDAGRALEPLVEVLLRERLASRPSGPSRRRSCAQAAWRSASVTRQVGVGQLDVLADERDLERRLGRLDPLDERAPAGRGPAPPPGRRARARGR